MEIHAFEFDDKYIPSFLQLPTSIYKEDPDYIPPFTEKLNKQLHKNYPYYRYGQAKHFLLKDNHAWVGRITAFVNSYAINSDIKIGYLGLFEVQPNQDYTNTLIEAGLDFLKSQGAQSVHAPINFSTWYAYRFVTYRGTAQPFYMEPYNPPYYPEHFVKAGFKKIKEYSSTEVTSLVDSTHVLKQYQNTFHELGYFVRPIQLHALKRELSLIYNLSLELFAQNFNFTPIPFEEFCLIYSGLPFLIKSKHVQFVYDPSNQPIGFIFTLPDYGVFIRNLKGKLSLYNKFKMGVCKPNVDRLLIKTIAVRSGFRKVPVGSMLIGTMHEYAINNKMNTVIHALMSENNTSQRYAKHNNSVLREYSLFSTDI